MGNSDRRKKRFAACAGEARGRSGAVTHVRFAVAECPLGLVLTAATERGVSAIALGEDREALTSELRVMFPDAELSGGGASLAGIVAKVVSLAERPGTTVDLSLDIRGTAFQRRVWKAIQAIPAGTTATYSEVAERIGAPKAVRAVAGACAANKLALAIPCHRVIRSDGGAGGYRWGIKRKTALLERERRRT